MEHKDESAYKPTVAECKAFGRMNKGYLEPMVNMVKKKPTGFASIKVFMGKDEYGKPIYERLVYKPIALCRYEYNKMLKVNPSCKVRLKFEIEYK